MRYAAILLSGLLTLMVVRPAVGQTGAEYGAGAANSSTSSGIFKSLGDTLSGVLGNSSKTTSSASETVKASDPAPAKPETPSTSKKPHLTASKKRTPVKTVPVAQAAPRPAYEDPHQIQVGLGYDELVRRFGPPTLAFTDGPNTKTLNYVRKDGVVKIRVADETVTSAPVPKS